jgi:hypothetical protein
MEFIRLPVAKIIKAVETASDETKRGKHDCHVEQRTLTRQTWAKEQWREHEDVLHPLSRPEQLYNSGRTHDRLLSRPIAPSAKMNLKTTLQVAGQFKSVLENASSIHLELHYSKRKKLLKS